MCMMELGELEILMTLFELTELHHAHQSPTAAAKDQNARRALIQVRVREGRAVGKRGRKDRKPGAGLSGSGEGGRLRSHEQEEPLEAAQRDKQDQRADP